MTDPQDQMAPPGSLPGDKQAFQLILERHMQAMVGELDYLIGLHEQWGDTLQKTHLHKARATLKSGLDWFDWARRRATEVEAMRQPVAWMTTDDPPRVASAWSREGMHEPMKQVFSIPLYRTPT